MAADDRIEIEILEDGTIRATTGALAGPNHASADQFVGLLDKLLGGHTEVKNRGRHTHTHTHGTLTHRH